MLFQYLGTYGRHAMEFGRILRHPSQGHNLIDRKQYAKAFAEQGVLADNIVADLVLQLGLNHVLDLGCGAGTLLLNLASRNADFAGWGLDSNAWMCAAARKRIASLRMGKRIGIFQGDCRDLRRSLPASVVTNVSVIIAASVMNEFFAEGITKAVECLAGISATFPGQTMLIADYYGDGKNTGRSSSKKMALHNFIQIVSGQGVPPANLSGWKKIYQGAGCHFIHAVQLQDSPYFIHILKL
jgi:SAM-dependent methyltransferase